MSTINFINRVGAPTPLGAPSETIGTQAPVDVSFGDLLAGMVNDVNELQVNAGELREQLISGESGDLHQVMIAAEEAGVAMELLIEVRNKLVDAYQQLMRMPV